MDNNAYYADEIMRNVDMLEATQFYGLTYNRSGFAQCCFHADKTASFKIQKQLYGHCFGCGWNGNIIQFVMKLFNLSFLDALRKINDDFLLALPIDRRPTLREQRDAERKQKEMLAERARREAEQNAYNELYRALWDEYARLDRNRMDYAPVSTDEEFNPLYVEAVSKISYTEYLIDILL